MTILTLSQVEISNLKRLHKAARKRREANRIKAIILLSTGWTIRGVAAVLLLDDETIRNYLNHYKAGELNALLNDSYKGYRGKSLNPEMEQLDSHLNDKIYLRTQGIVFYVTRNFKENTLVE